MNINKNKRLIDIYNTISKCRRSIQSMKKASMDCSKGTLIFESDYTKINGYSERCHVHALVAYNIVIEKTKDKIKELEKEMSDLQESCWSRWAKQLLYGIIVRLTRKKV